MPLLEVERLSKGFGGVRAVSDVSFALDEGELLGIMGPNGSGKTTLFNLIAGALSPDAGRIRLGGQDIAGLPPPRSAPPASLRPSNSSRPSPGPSRWATAWSAASTGPSRPRTPKPTPKPSG